MDSFWFVVSIVLLFFLIGGVKRDDSDGEKRSGMIVYTDALTGCQYVGTILGSITPRLDKDGKIVCVKK